VTHGIWRECPPGLAFELSSWPAAPRGAWGVVRRLFTALRAQVLAGRLDAALARGDDPCDSAVLAHRAVSLTSRRSRGRLATSLETVVAAAARPAARRSAAIDPCRTEMEAAEPLLSLAGELLRSARPVYAQGVAALACLLRDGGSPLYAPPRPGALREDLELITAALQGADQAEL
jgi:hypothetical protein